ncbi:hypothetical protein BD779DRAFT_1466109 [Infundibulicybe gibba]|nr:hypothetical protein BD779DRAFT_1466109 [Infundibulicybe gibba]
MAAEQSVMITIAAMGEVRSGKSSFVNLASGSKLCVGAKRKKTSGILYIHRIPSSTVSAEVSEARELELATSDIYFKPALNKGAKLLRHTRTVESAHNVFRHLISNLNEPPPPDDHTKFPTRSPEEELQAQAMRHRHELQQLVEEVKVLASRSDANDGGRTQEGVGDGKIKFPRAATKTSLRSQRGKSEAKEVFT